MPGTPKIDVAWNSVRCMEDVAGAVQRLPFSVVPGNDEPASPLAELERLLLQGAFAEALALCKSLQPLPQGALFVPLIRSIDARWNADEIGFSDLAFAFFQVRRLIELLRDPATFNAAPRGPVLGRVLLACAPGEDHTFGVQIVSGELSLQGWDVELAASAGPDEICQRLSDKSFDALGLTVGHDGAMDGLADLIAEARIASCNPSVSVILGGAALLDPATSFDFLGADKVCQSASEAVEWLVGHHVLRHAENRN